MADAVGRARSKRDALGPALAANDRRALSRGGAEATQIRPAAARAVHVRAAMRQVPTRPNVPSPCATSHNVRSALHALYRIRYSSAKQYGTVLYSMACVLLYTELRRGHAKVDGSSGCRRHVGVGRRSDSARRSKSIQTIHLHKIPHAR